MKPFVRAFLSLFVAWPCLVLAQVDYRHFQVTGEVPDLAAGTQAHAVTSMLETCLGSPSCLSAAWLNELVPKSNGRASNYLFHFSEAVQDQGIPACIHENTAQGAESRQRYKVPKGTVQHWGGNAAADVERLKALLDRGQKSVAVNYFLPATRLRLPPKGKTPVYKLEDFAVLRVAGKSIPIKKARKQYAEFWQQLLDKKLQILPQPKDSSDYDLIAFNVVGYDDKGFIVRGAFGPDWGEAGYVHFAYDLHRWASKEVLAMLMLEPMPHKAGENVHLHDFHLRTLPEKLDGVPYLQLFVVESGSLPVSPVTHLSYEITPATPPGSGPQILKALVSPLSCSSGFPVLAKLDDPSAVHTVVVKYRCSNGELRELKFEGVRWENGNHE